MREFARLMMLVLWEALTYGESYLFKMEVDVFLLGLGVVWTAFAVFQDFKTTEVANWLSYSLIGFVLAYRAFFSIEGGDWSFFFLGLCGVLIFVGVAYVFYYSKMFGGGDAKLLMGFGGILPYSNFGDLAILGGGFLILFLVVGLVYTLAYSLGIVYKNREKFGKEFRKQVRENLTLVAVFVFVGVLVEFADYYLDAFSFGLGIVFFLFVGLLFFYARALEDTAMIKEIDAFKLREGDWLEKQVKVGGKTIRKSVHGLSEDEIRLLRKHKKKVWIKEGVPFTPTFLISLVLFALVIEKGLGNFSF